MFCIAVSIEIPYHLLMSGKITQTLYIYVFILIVVYYL